MTRFSILRWRLRFWRAANELVLKVPTIGLVVTFVDWRHRAAHEAYYCERERRR